MKLAGAILLVLALVLVGLWVAFVSAPPPQEVCQRKVDLVLADTQGQHDSAATSLVDHYRLTCRQQAENLLQFRGKLAYARYAKCVMSAADFGASERCG